ncbi:8888706b-f990-46ab-a549-7749c8c048a6 [Thermothielavioides terrestris]|nr:8888706b-f990-46ab-a549-7749c8c048a6 [Thermothielavioides terrestris]
MDDRIVL